MNRSRHLRRLAAGAATAALLLAACATGSTPSASSAPSDPTPGVPVTAPPDGSSEGPSDPTGIGNGAKPVEPRPGQRNVHPVAADALEARVDGDTIVVTATWTSGVEPCNVLDSILVERGDASFAVTLREGNGPEDVVCIAIAEQHVTAFEIPDVAPGTYQITDAAGGAAPIEVTVA